MPDRPSDEPRPGSGEEPSIPDDVWDKFLKDTEAGIGSAPKEPSARARMVTERLRQQDARGERPENWRAGAATRPERRRRRVWPVLGVLLAAAVAVVAVKPSVIPGDPFGTKDDTSAAQASPLPPETAAPTAPPSSPDPDIPTLARPFAGSPAERWADGAAGIVLPKATPVGTLSKAQVEQALQQTRTLLVDANLNSATLRGERPGTALGVIEPKQTDLLTRLDTSLSKPDEKHDPLSMFSRFDPTEIKLVGDVVKTRGRITFKAGEQSSVAVHADYTFVYPVVRAGGSKEVTRTIVRRILDVQLSDPTRYQVTPGKITIRRYDRDIGNSACDVYDGYLHPEFTSDTPTGAAPSGPTTDPYDRSKGIDGQAKGCGTVSRV
ncbi:hypothetical protein ABZ848_12995 [Streptomyces sp. NPDC047081]|uniref:hypothetical protein n=1 Tax=Streptomyces sp. NPDC047081 TaxID=3154706 RepID=UPI0033FF11DF